MNLGETRIRKKGAFPMGPVSCGYIGSHGIGRKEKYISVAAGAQYDCMGLMAFNVPVNQVADHNSSGLTVNHNKLQHFTARKQLNFSSGHLAGQGTVSSQKQLLPRLSSGVKSAGNLGAAK